MGHTRSRFQRWTVTLVVLIPLAGCGGGEPVSTTAVQVGPTEPATTPQPASGDGLGQGEICQLITTADLEEITGIPWEEGEGTELPAAETGGVTAATCLYLTGESEFVLGVTAWSDSALAPMGGSEAFRDSLGQQIGQGRSIDVGEGGVVSHTGLFANLVMMASDHVFQISLVSNRGAPLDELMDEAGMIELAERIVDRL